MLALVGEALCRGVETCRFEFAVAIGATVDAGGARGGRGGGILSNCTPDFSKTILCGRGGIAGLDSPVISAAVCILLEPFVSSSLSRLLFAVAG